MNGYFSPESLSEVAAMLEFADFDWERQFETGKGPGSGANMKDLGPSDRRHPQELVPPLKKGRAPKTSSESISPVAYPKGPGNPQGGSSKDVQGMRMLG